MNSLKTQMKEDALWLKEAVRREATFCRKTALSHREVWENNKLIPSDIRLNVQRVKRALLRYKDTKGLFIIGSIVDRTYNKNSDIDFVWVKSRRLNYDKLLDLQDKLNLNNSRDGNLRIQLICFSPENLSWHFNNASTMAHCIKRGITIYEKRNGIITNSLRKDLSQPTNKWMKHWFEHWLLRYKWAKYSIKRRNNFHKKFCRSHCTCDVFDDIARVTVNFAILFLETNHIVPTSRTQIAKYIKPYLNDNLFSVLRLALRVSCKDRPLTLKQGNKILDAATWFQEKLYYRIIKKINYKISKVVH